MRKQIGLFFGSFNPIHIGHLILANHLAEHSALHEVWLVVTPQNPFKEKQSLLDIHLRLEMAELAVDDYPKLRTCNIEFHLPQPNYTVNTLAHLGEKYPDVDFALIMGEDNLKSFHKWKNYEHILANYQLYIYPRISEGGVAEGGGGDTCNLSFHKTALLLCDLDIADIPWCSEGNKEYLAVYMGERLAFPSKTSDRDAF